MDTVFSGLWFEVHLCVYEHNDSCVLLYVCPCAWTCLCADTDTRTPSYIKINVLKSNISTNETRERCTSSQNVCFRIQQQGVYFLQKQGHPPSTLGTLQLPILTDLSNHPVLMAVSSGVGKKDRGLKMMCPRTRIMSFPLTSVYLHNTALTQNCNYSSTILYSTNFQICGSE